VTLKFAVDELVRQQTEQWYEEYLRDKAPADYKAPKYPRYDLFMKLICHESKKSKILDIGCGIGDVLHKLRESGYENLVGYDFSELAAVFARKRGFEVIVGDISDVDSLSSLGNDYDLIIMGDILEHIFAPRRTLLNVRKLLKTNGKLLLSVPNAGWFMNGILLSFFPKYMSLSNSIGVWTHVNQYTFWLIERQLESCGFFIEKSLGVSDCRFQARSKKFLRNIGCLTMDLVFQSSGLLAKTKPSIFSRDIVCLARKDENMPVQENYFRGELGDLK
jgi:SAM-dependent methyltransferase